MDIRLVAVGRMKEKYLNDGIAEYQKRITRFASFNIVEIKDESAPESLSAKELEKVKDVEGKRILEAIKPGEFVIALVVKGKRLTSEEFSALLSDVKLRGFSKVAFLIGGSNGLSDEVTARADLSLSFSSFTFPHQLMRLILTEQIYRALTIEAGIPYHK